MTHSGVKDMFVIKSIKELCGANIGCIDGVVGIIGQRLFMMVSRCYFVMVFGC